MNNNWSAEAWRRVVESSPEGIVICDAAAKDRPVLFVNKAFEEMCGYPAAALVGTNLRMLQGTDRDQEARTRLREALDKGEPARVLVRNYRPDGSLFWNEMLVQPVRSPARVLTHFIGYHRDASERLKAAERSPGGLPTWLREDRLTGLHSRAFFEELLQRDWVLAARDSHEIGPPCSTSMISAPTTRSSTARRAMPASGASRAWSAPRTSGAGISSAAGRAEHSPC
jgi:PAS domain S-box-containing protein